MNAILSGVQDRCVENYRSTNDGQKVYRGVKGLKELDVEASLRRDIDGVLRLTSSFDSCAEIQKIYDEYMKSLDKAVRSFVGVMLLQIKKEEIDLEIRDLNWSELMADIIAIQQQGFAKVMNLLGGLEELKNQKFVKRMMDWLPRMLMKGEDHLEKFEALVSDLLANGFTLEELINIFNHLPVLLGASMNTVCAAWDDLKDIYGVVLARELVLRTRAILQYVDVKKTFDELAEIYDEDYAKQLGFQNPRVFVAKNPKLVRKFLIEKLGEEDADDILSRNPFIFCNDEIEVLYADLCELHNEEDVKKMVKKDTKILERNLVMKSHQAVREAFDISSFSELREVLEDTAEEVIAGCMARYDKAIESIGEGEVTTVWPSDFIDEVMAIMMAEDMPRIYVVSASKIKKRFGKLKVRHGKHKAIEMSWNVKTILTSDRDMDRAFKDLEQIYGSKEAMEILERDASLYSGYKSVASIYKSLIALFSRGHSPVRAESIVLKIGREVPGVFRSYQPDVIKYYVNKLGLIAALDLFEEHPSALNNIRDYWAKS